MPWQTRLYREEAYLEKLELLLRTAKELAACRAQLEALDRRGVPEGSVIFSRPVKRYRGKTARRWSTGIPASICISRGKSIT